MERPANAESLLDCLTEWSGKRDIDGLSQRKDIVANRSLYLYLNIQVDAGPRKGPAINRLPRRQIA